MIAISRWLPLWDDCHYEMIAIMRWLPLWDDCHYEMIAIMRWLPLWDDCHYEMIAIMRWLPLWVHNASIWYTCPITKSHPGLSIDHGYWKTPWNHLHTCACIYMGLIASGSWFPSWHWYCDKTSPQASTKEPNAKVYILDLWQCMIRLY